MIEAQNSVLAVDISSGSEIGVQLQNEGILDAEIKLLYIKNGEKEIASYVAQKVMPDLQMFVDENKLEMTGLLCETREIAAEAAGNVEEASLIQENIRQIGLEIEQVAADVVSFKDICVEKSAAVELNAQVAAASEEKSLAAKSQSLEAASNSQHWAELSQSASGVCYLFADGGVILAKENDDFLVAMDGTVELRPSVTVAFPVGRDEKFRNRSEIYTHNEQLFVGIYDSSGGGNGGGLDTGTEVSPWEEDTNDTEIFSANNTISPKIANPRCIFLKRSMSENNEYKYELAMYYFLGKHYNSDVPELPVSAGEVYCYYNIDFHQYYIANADFLSGGDSWIAAVLCPLGYLDSNPSSRTNVICFPTYSLVTADDWGYQQNSMVGTLALSPLDNLNGYLLCNGAAISRTAYSKLFAVLGVKYGSGDGSTTFNIPDFRGDFLRGYLAGTSAAIGSRQNEGLPEIKGTLTCGKLILSPSTSGAFSHTSSSESYAGTSSGNSTELRSLNFSAAKSNSIYGANSHVTPRNSAINYFIKY